MPQAPSARRGREEGTGRVCNNVVVVAESKIGFPDHTGSEWPYLQTRVTYSALPLFPHFNVWPLLQRVEERLLLLFLSRLSSPLRYLSSGGICFAKAQKRLSFPIVSHLYRLGGLDKRERKGGPDLPISACSSLSLSPPILLSLSRAIFLINGLITPSSFYHRGDLTGGEKRAFFLASERSFLGYVRKKKGRIKSQRKRGREEGYT